MKKSCICLGLSLAITACGETQSHEVPNENYYNNHWTQTNPEKVGDGKFHETSASTAREARRLTVDNLRKSIPLLFNNVTWTQRVRNVEVNMFDQLSRTLGEADYLEVTVPNTEPSPLFAKFMDDMAGQVCEKAIQSDLRVAESERSFVRSPDDVDENLRFIRLKFHGIYVPQSSTEGIKDLRILYDDILSDTGSPDIAWYGVCVATITAPEFMAY